MATTGKMLHFVDRDQKMPQKRGAAERTADFDEIYAEFSKTEAEAQAGRCSQCGVPFCQIHCPVSNNIPDWLKLTAENRLEEAYEISQATNTFPEICGRICPQDRLCEGNCVIEKGFDSVTIGSVEKYITDTAFEKGWVKPIAPPQERAQSIGIIGAGPGGLAAADALRRKGYQVHVYDRYDRAGGLMIYGIPNFKLEKEVVQRRQKLLGVYKARAIEAPGVGLANIVPAMTYLTASNRKGLGDEVPDFDDGTLDAAGKNVVVIGGGDTAMDCVRTAVRQGAKSVKCLYRRDKKNMPGSQREVYNAEEEGVEFVWLAAPEAFLAKSGKAKKKAGSEAVGAVRAYRMRLGIADSTGRQLPEKIEESSFDLPCDLAIQALGFDPEDVPTMFGAPELAVTRWGTLKVNHRTMMTAIDGVFAAGDIVRGASLVVWAIRDGKDAAAAIHKYLAAKAAPASVAAE